MSNDNLDASKCNVDSTHILADDVPKAPSQVGIRRKLFTVSVRGLRSFDNTAVPFDHDDPLKAYSEALSYRTHPDPEPVMQWRDRRAACCVDWDWHGDQKPKWEDVSRIMLQCPLIPSSWWITHGGGLRWVFFGFTHTESGLVVEADEIAALAVVIARQRSYELRAALTGVELKTETRHPMYPKADGSRAGPVWGGLNPSIHALRLTAKRLFRQWEDPADFDPETVEDELRDRGLHGSDRFSHGLCPINPTPGNDKGNAVVVLEQGVYCHSCAAKGFTYPGCNKPGWVPFARLVNPGVSGSVATPVEAMASRFAHWDHARHVLRHLLGGGRRSMPLADDILRPAYSALIKLRHLELALWRQSQDSGFDVEEYMTGAEGLRKSALYAPTPFIRSAAGLWVHAGQPEKPLAEHGRSQLIGSLPAVQYFDNDAQGWKTSKKTHGLLQNNGPVEALGYYPCRVAGRIDLLGLTGDVVRAGDAAPIFPPMDPMFVYFDAAKRGEPFLLTTWEAYLLSCFPGLDLRALKVAIGAIAFGQLPRSEPIRVAFEGQSGAGKSSISYLAAELVGTHVAGVPFTRDRDKFLRAYAASQGKIALTDECAKSGVPPTEMQALILAVRRGEQFHALYAGATPILYPGVHFFADTKYPALFLEDVQIARRMIGVKIGAGAVGQDWMKSSDGGIEGWRSRCELNTYVANCIVSEVMDAIRAHGSFESYAASLEFFPLSKQAEEGYDPNAPLRDLFVAVMNAPERRGGRFSGQGWRVFSEGVMAPPKDEPAENGPLALAWDELRGANGQVDTQRLTGAQWSNIVPIPGLDCKVETHGRKVGIRFLVGSERRKDTKFGVAVLDGLPANHALWERITSATPNVQAMALA